VLEYCVLEYCVLKYCVIEYCVLEYCVLEYCVLEYCVLEYSERMIQSSSAERTIPTAQTFLISTDLSDQKSKGQHSKAQQSAAKHSKAQQSIHTFLGVKLLLVNSSVARVLVTTYSSRTEMSARSHTNKHLACSPRPRLRQELHPDLFREHRRDLHAQERSIQNKPHDGSPWLLAWTFGSPETGLTHDELGVSQLEREPDPSLTDGSVT
jgi:hypothetical protein